MEKLQQMLKDSSKDAMLFYNAMKSFVEVEHDSFGVDLRTPEYRASLKQLREDVVMLPIKKIPLKLHVICVHLDQRYAERHACSMRPFLYHTCFNCCILYTVIAHMRKLAFSCIPYFLVLTADSHHFSYVSF